MANPATVTAPMHPLHPAFWLATWFGSGLAPKAPGTFGSAAALPFAWGLMWLGGVPALAAGIVVVFLLGWWASEVYVRRAGIDDPGSIVIDEVAGQWLVLLAAPLDPVWYLLGFLLFRLFDIAKFWPASWADRVVKGGLGVMLDDVLAALYGLALMAFAVSLA